MIFLVLYVFGFFLAWTIAWPRMVGEYDIHDFGDFGTVAYLVLCLSLIWPVVAIGYGAWLVFQRTQV